MHRPSSWIIADVARQSEDLRDAADTPFTLKAQPVNKKIDNKTDFVCFCL